MDSRKIVSEFAHNKKLTIFLVKRPPDLCYVVTRLSQYMSKPTLAHMTMAKHVLMYLKGTRDRNMVFQASKEPLKLFAYCDAIYWGSSDDTGSSKSITGYRFQLSADGPLISWKSRK